MRRLVKGTKHDVPLMDLVRYTTSARSSVVRLQRALVDAGADDEQVTEILGWVYGQLDNTRLRLTELAVYDTTKEEEEGGGGEWWQRPRPGGE